MDFEQEESVMSNKQTETLPLERQEAAAPPSNGMAALLGKLLKAQQSIQKIEKDKTNEHFKYDYASAATVAHHVRNALHEQGLLLVLSETAERREVLKDSKTDQQTGEIRTRETLIVTKEITATVYDTATGQSLSVKVSGDGTDTSDKAPYKAATGTGKYARLFLMDLASGDDPENEAGKKRKSSDAPAEDDGGKKDYITMKAKWPVKCAVCGKEIPKGENQVWLKGSKLNYCPGCVPKDGDKPSGEPAAQSDPSTLATEKQKGVIDKFIANRTLEDKEWWASVYPETLTQERAGQMIKWLGSHKLDEPLPLDEWNAMLAGAK